MPDTWREMLAFVFGMDYKRKAPTKASLKEETKGEDPEEDEELEIEPGPTSIQDELKAKKYENLGVWVESNIYFKNFKRIKL